LTCIFCKVREKQRVKRKKRETKISEDKKLYIREKKMSLEIGTGQEKKWRETGLHNNIAGNNSL
jgi:hypothetical protein